MDRDVHSEPACFTNTYAQVLHKYSDLVLAVLIATLGYWLSGLDTKYEKIIDDKILIERRVATLESGQGEIMRLLNDIKFNIEKTDTRITKLNDKVETLRVYSGAVGTR